MPLTSKNRCLPLWNIGTKSWHIDEIAWWRVVGPSLIKRKVPKYTEYTEREQIDDDKSLWTFSHLDKILHRLFFRCFLIEFSNLIHLCVCACDCRADIEAYFVSLYKVLLDNSHKSPYITKRLPSDSMYYLYLLWRQHSICGGMDSNLIGNRIRMWFELTREFRRKHLRHGRYKNDLNWVGFDEICETHTHTHSKQTLFPLIYLLLGSNVTNRISPKKIVYWVGCRMWALW